MSRNPLFHDLIDELKEVGDFTVIPYTFSKNQVANALCYFGKKRGIRLSYVRTSDGYMVTLVEKGE